MDNTTQLKNIDEVYCDSCGKAIKKEAEVCPFCGASQNGYNTLINTRTEKSFDEMYCSSCGKAIKKEAEICPFCGVRQKYNNIQLNNYSDKNWLTLLLLYLFLGWLGFHRFYAGKIVSGVFFVLTVYGLGIWGLIDFISIITKNFKDADGRYIRK